MFLMEDVYIFYILELSKKEQQKYFISQGRDNCTHFKYSIGYWDDGTLGEWQNLTLTH